MYAIASGGWWGVGLGASRQKWGSLPEAHSDFIFAVIGEELGLFGSLVVLLMFLVLAYAGIRIALRSDDDFNRYVAAGVTAWFMVQALINLGCVLRLLPIAGVPLPLVSYGGSALMANLAGDRAAAGLRPPRTRRARGAAATPQRPEPRMTTVVGSRTSGARVGRASGGGGEARPRALGTERRAGGRRHRRAHLTADRDRARAGRAAPRHPDHRARHRARAGDHGRPRRRPSARAHPAGADAPQPTRTCSGCRVGSGRSVKAAEKVLREVRAGVVLGFGGYVSTPAYLAARRLKLPIVVHEQNVLPGLANKLAARFTDHVYTSFAETELPHASWIGLPMRRAITELDRAAERASARAEFGLAADRPVLLVSGGSQGAAQINTAVRGRPGRPARLRGSRSCTCSARRNFGAETTYTHPDNGAVYRPLAYVERMERAYAAADLMLGRCGASTVLETAVVGLPAVFVPYPHGNGEQRRNARLVVEAGGGQLVEDADCTPELVAARIPELVDEPGRLAGMSVALRGVARGDAASTLARRTLEVARAWA